MRISIVVATAAASLGLAGAAAAGGWATVKMSAYPGNAEPGKPWNVDLTVLQHGVRPLAGVRPVFRIRSLRTGEERSFPAAPTATRGVYRASVVFPGPGRWDYEIDDGFGETHTYAPVVIGEPAAPAARGAQGDGAPAAIGIALGAFGVVAAALAVLALARRQRRRPATA
ncbi:MAG TPA: hypothetical protein VHF67_14025 [Gaiellaceae bacterium]|nr:hypothetical protein [Gaiellaceae bacterium]